MTCTDCVLKIKIKNKIKNKRKKFEGEEIFSFFFFFFELILIKIQRQLLFCTFQMMFLTNVCLISSFFAFSSFYYFTSLTAFCDGLILATSPPPAVSHQRHKNDETKPGDSQGDSKEHGIVRLRRDGNGKGTALDVVPIQCHLQAVGSALFLAREVCDGVGAIVVVLDRGIDGIVGLGYKD